jgi:hypothetical protein
LSCLNVSVKMLNWVSCHFRIYHWTSFWGNLINQKGY